MKTDMEHYTNSCDACGGALTFMFGNPFSPEKGFTFDISGGYGQFTDYLGHDSENPFIICHDCVLRMIELFPAMRERIKPASHPCSEDSEPCCEFAWTIIDRKTMVPSHDLKSWVPR